MSFFSLGGHRVEAQDSVARRPASGLFDCTSPPERMDSLSLADEGGVLLAFVPPEADFNCTAAAWHRLSVPARTVITISSTGALCSQRGASAYCDMRGAVGSGSRRDS